MNKLIYLFTVIIGSESAKILGVFPIPSISHQVVFRPLMLELAKRGHEVIVITTDPAYPSGQTPANLTEIDLHDISYEDWNKFLQDNGHEKDRLVLMELMSDMVMELIQKQLESAQVQTFIQNNKEVDLLFIESSAEPAVIFSHIYKVPVIEFSSFSGIEMTFEMIGAATHPLIYPDVLHRRIHNLTLLEKMSELYHHFSVKRVFENLIFDKTILKSLFGPDVPSIKELKRNVHMLFLNVNPIWDFNRPVPPNVVYLGGLHQKPQSDLPKDLKSYLDSSKNGVIYISFGTNVKPSWIPQERLKIFINVLSELPYDVLWKWDKDELPGRPQNVRILKWLPQSDLLRHPKIKLFITQGGLQSTDEAITAGVPLVGVPMLSDQWFNVEQYVKHNIGKHVMIETLTENQLMDAITTVINDNSYRRNIIKLRNIIRDQPQSPLERAVWWTEYVLRHAGAKHLAAPSAHINWGEYYELELVILLLGAIVLAVLTTVLTLYFIISKVKYYTVTKVKVN